MATQEEQNFITKTRNEFVMSAENAIKEIHDKFASFHSQLDQGESNLINNVEKIRKDILQKFDEITPKLEEIQQCRAAAISILRNNSNKQLLETQLSSFTAEIEGVIGQSGIDNLIGLKWKYCELPINNVCTFTTISAEWNRTRLYNNDLPIGDPNKDTRRDEGVLWGDPGTTYLPNTPNEPRMDPSRYADETHKGNQLTEMFGARDASETHNQTESFKKTQNYKSQSSSFEFISYFLELIPKLPKGDFLKPVPDKNTGVNNPDSARSQPTEWTCPHCTLVNAPGIRVCNACSKAPVSYPQTANVIPTGIIKCVHCSALNLNNELFCKDCGCSLL